MKNYVVFFVFLLCLMSVLCDDKKIGKPTFTLEGSAAGKNFRNFQGGFNAGVGTRVWQKKDKSLDIGASYGRNYARVDGHTFKSKPNFGVGATFRWGKK